MLQEGGLYPGVRPLEALELFASYYDDPDDPERLLRLVGLDDSRHTLVRRMSGGQQQRLSLALALIGQAEARVPRRADRGHGPARPRDDVVDDPRAARPRDHRRAHHARDGRSRAPLRPRRASSTTVDWWRATRPRSSRPTRRRRRPRSRPSPVSPVDALAAHARARARRGARAAPRRLPRRRAGDARRCSRASPRGWPSRARCSASCAPGRRSLEDVFLRLTGEGRS